MRADELLAKRKDRAVAIIMHTVERDIYPLLDQVSSGEQAKRKLRKVVLDQVNDFYNLAIDVVASGEAQYTEFNADVWEQRLQRLETNIVAAVNER